MDKKLNLLYFSGTDTTAKIVKSVGHGIGQNPVEYNITLPRHRKSELIFDDNDLVVVGIPVYAGRVPEFLGEYFSKVRGNNTFAVYIVVYGNRAYDDALLELKNTFEANGFIGLAAGAFIGEHSYSAKLAEGRPDMNDLNIARYFGTNIKEGLKMIPGGKTGDLFVKGHFPYRDRNKTQPVAIETDDHCVECGICAENCPMGVISFIDYRTINSMGCIKCNRCIKRCPENAKEITYEPHKKFTRELVDKFGVVRLEPELFWQE